MTWRPKGPRADVEYMFASQAAEATGRALRTIYRWADDGTLTPYLHQGSGPYVLVFEAQQVRALAAARPRRQPQEYRLARKRAWQGALQALADKYQKEFREIYARLFQAELFADELVEQMRKPPVAPGGSNPHERQIP